MLAVLLLLTSAWASAQQLTALFSYATFDIPGGTPYVETYLNFDAWNMTFVPTGDGQYRATVEVSLVAWRDDEAAFVKKYDLESPAIATPEMNNFNFLDVQRFALQNGIYTLEITLRDKADSGAPLVVSQKIVVNYVGKQPRLSSVQFMSAATPTVKQNILSRNGYDMQPYVNDFVPKQMKSLSFYYEVYHIDHEISSRDFTTIALIEQAETGIKVAGMEKISSHKGAKTVPVYETMDISTLPSGNYNLLVEVRNRENDLMLFQRVPFIRSNPDADDLTLLNYETSFAARITDENMLNYYLEALYPVASEVEKAEARALSRTPGRLGDKQNFFYRFWVARNQLNPESEWRTYQERLEYVAAHFSMPKRAGYLTDRGRVYLQYGPPDFVRDEKNFVSALRLGSGTNSQRMITGDGDPSLGYIYYLPYQLWRYNSLPADESNRVFLFWDEFRNGWYALLNSNAKGEVQEVNWERRLSRNQLDEGVVGEVGEQFDRGR